MSVTTISNKLCRTLVLRHEEFKASNIFARKHIVWRPVVQDCDREPDFVESGYVYAVYSYGEHFPMYVFDSEVGQWFGNEDRYSVTTSKHQTQTRPGNVTHWVNTTTLTNIITRGYINYVSRRIQQS